MFFMDTSGDNKLVFYLGFLFVYFFNEDIISAFFFLFINDKEVKIFFFSFDNMVLNLSKVFRIIL